MWLTPLCPAGHLPLKGGDRISGTRGHSSNMPPLGELLQPSIVSRQPIADRDFLIGHEVSISPLEGEMSRSDRGGCPDTIANPNLPLIRLPAPWPALRMGSGRSSFETIHRIVSSAAPTIPHPRKRGEGRLPHPISPPEGEMPGRAEGGTPSRVAAYGVFA